MTKEMSKVWFKNAVPNNFNGREGAGSHFIINGSFELRVACNRFRPTSSQSFGGFAE